MEKWSYYKETLIKLNVEKRQIADRLNVAKSQLKQFMQNETESWKLPSVDGSQCVLANLPGAVGRTHSAHPGLHCELLRGSRQLRRMVTRIVLFVALLSVMVTSNNYCDIRQFDGYSVFFTSCKKIEGQPFEIVDFNNFTTMEDLQEKVQMVKDYSRGKLHHIEWPQYLQDDMVDCIQGQTTLICDEWYNMSGTNKISSRCFPPASPSYWLDDEDKRDLAKCSTRDASGSPLDLLLDGDKIIVDTFEKGSIYLLQEEYLANKPTYYYHSNDGEHYRTLVGGVSAETSTTTTTLETSTTTSSPPSTNQTTTEVSAPADVTSVAEEPASARKEPIPAAVASSTLLPLSTTEEAQPENSTTTSAVHAEITFNVTMTEEAATTSKEPAPVTTANATSSSVLETQMTTEMQPEELTTTLAAPAEVTSNVTATEEPRTSTSS
ncbi:hypothetical protein QR680_011535 [Steinernema hermaphroditum]|uniref:Uncharacterized protein n=1 Tax=Steinernema hermaphroditum TaxID=289476 RepID=A0AA39I0D3_9BILA|nr:hypothetical protein QR680_011535 [Steinernema hermaphroditum]